MKLTSKEERKASVKGILIQVKQILHEKPHHLKSENEKRKPKQQNKHTQLTQAVQKSRSARFNKPYSLY